MLENFWVDFYFDHWKPLNNQLKLFNIFLKKSDLRNYSQNFFTVFYLKSSWLLKKKYIKKKDTFYKHVFYYLDILSYFLGFSQMFLSLHVLVKICALFIFYKFSKYPVMFVLFIVLKIRVQAVASSFWNIIWFLPNMRKILFYSLSICSSIVH